MRRSNNKINCLAVGGNAVSAFLSWRLSATNACDVTLVWKSGFDTVAQYGITFKYGHERIEKAGIRSNTGYRSSNKALGQERFKPRSGERMSGIQPWVVANMPASRPNTRRGCSDRKSSFRLCPSLRQGSTRRLRSRRNNRVCRFPSAHLHPHQHNTFARCRVLPRVKIPHKCCVITCLRSRAHASKHKRVRAHGIDRVLGRSCQCQPRHSSIHSVGYGGSPRNDSELWSS